MVYKKLYLSVSIRVTILGITLFALVYSWQKWNDPLISVNILALVLLQVILFIRSMNQVNYKLATFIDSLDADDAALFSTKGFQDRSFRQLYGSMQDVLCSVQQKNAAHYRQKQFYQAVNEHAGTAILAYNDEQKILLCNQAFRELFNTPAAGQLEEIESPVKGFIQGISALRAGEQKLLHFTIRRAGLLDEGTKLELSVRKAVIRLVKENVHILSFQDIKPELENRESESWEKIIRVLTHEIMNTSGPLVSSVQTLISLVAGEDRDKTIHPADVTRELIQDLLEGLKIIEDRSMGLDRFVKDFRKVTLLPEPAFEPVKLSPLVKSLGVLYDKKLQDNEILFSVDIEEDLCIFADKTMMEQLLMNLLNNAIDAMKSPGPGRIAITAGKTDHKVMIQVSDTGSGLSREDLEKVFIPFFTRKKQGSGIGLSLARQIMRKHGGTIRITSKPGKGSTVIIDGLPIT